MTDRGNPLFGDWSRYARGEGAAYVTTPVGEVCGVCREAVVDGDAGEIVPHVGMEGIGPRPVHRECFLLEITGHDFGVCRCTEYAGLASRRDAGRELERRMRELGPPWRRGSA